MFKNLVATTCRLTNETGSPTVDINFALPAVLEPRKSLVNVGMFTPAWNPDISISEGITVLEDHWGKSSVEDGLLNRLILVRARAPISKMMKAAVTAKPDISQEELTKPIQDFVNDTWNTDLQYPKAERSSAPTKEVAAKKIAALPAEEQLALLLEMAKKCGLKVIDA